MTDFCKDPTGCPLSREIKRSLTQISEDYTATQEAYKENTKVTQDTNIKLAAISQDMKNTTKVLEKYESVNQAKHVLFDGEDKILHKRVTDLSIATAKEISDASIVTAKSIADIQIAEAKNEVAEAVKDGEIIASTKELKGRLTGKLDVIDLIKLGGIIAVVTAMIKYMESIL